MLWIASLIYDNTVDGDDGVGVVDADDGLIFLMMRTLMMLGVYG